MVEADDPVGGGRAVQVSRMDDILEADQSLEKAIEKIKPAAEAVLSRLRSLAVKPDEISVDFGIKLSAKAGALIAATAAEANFQVSLKWKGSSPGSGGVAVEV